MAGSRGHLSDAPFPSLPPELKAVLAALEVQAATIIVAAFLVADVPDRARAGFLAFGFALGYHGAFRLGGAIVDAISRYIEQLWEWLDEWRRRRRR